MSGGQLRWEGGVLIKLPTHWGRVRFQLLIRTGNYLPWIKGGRRLIIAVLSLILSVLSFLLLLEEHLADGLILLVGPDVFPGDAVGVDGLREDNGVLPTRGFDREEGIVDGALGFAGRC